MPNNKKQKKLFITDTKHHIANNIELVTDCNLNIDIKDRDNNNV